MSTPVKIHIPRLYLILLFLGVITTLIFSSWGNAERSISLRKQAGENAFSKVTVQQQITLNGAALNYNAASGYLSVSDGESHNAELFYTAYTTGSAKRPLTFVFNGGPGSSSIWLHMGSFGPVRAVPGKAGYQNNTDTWLGFTDIVFIDPVGTGYSRPEDGVDTRRFYSYEADIRSVADFINRYLAENNRQNAPVFLAGESYGAARAVGLAAYLKDSLNLKVAGITLISPALDYKLVSFKKGNDNAYPYYISAYALTAQYHHRLSPALQQLSPEDLKAKVNCFAFGAYKDALLSKANLSDKVLDTLSRYTGISIATLKQFNGRLTDNNFAALLLSNTEGKTGIYDSRDTGPMGIADPSEQRLRATFTQAFQDYRGNALQYQTRLPYLATIATPQWNYGPAAQNGLLNVVPVLKSLLNSSANINVHIVNGEYDLATPTSTVEKLLADLGAEQAKVSAHTYAAGHMIYTDDAANKEWHTDTQKFYQKVMNK